MGRVLLALAACAAIGATGALAQAPRSEAKVALVIGNAAYPTAPLRNPVNDAKAIAAKLQSLGFDVILRTDLTQRDMTRAFGQFGQKLTPGSVGLFYFAGHGLQVQGKNFLVPVDAEIQSEGSVRTEAVDVDLALHQLAPARLSMVVLDACRNNPFERRFRGTGGGLAQIDAPTGTLIAYATAPGKTAGDGPGANGLYTTELLKAIDQPGLPVEEVFKVVRVNVLKASANRQIPWEASSLTGEFNFRPAAPVVDPRLAEAERQRAEMAKSLADDRKQREADSAAMKREMDALRAELARVREAIPAKPVEPPAKAPEPAPARPPMLVSAKPADPPPKVAEAPVKAPPSKGVETAPVKSPEPAPTVVALAPPTSSSALPPSGAGEWARRLELLQSQRGKLTLGKALALLLDITTDTDLAKVVRMEAITRSYESSSALAMGVNANGRLAWGAITRERSSAMAEESAMHDCKRRDRGGTCAAVLVDGEFREDNFFAVARTLGAGTIDVLTVRQAYVNTPMWEPPPRRGVGRK